MPSSVGFEPQFDFEAVFPGLVWSEQQDLRRRYLQTDTKSEPSARRTIFTEAELERFSKMFTLLDNDKDSKALLATIIAYCDLKSKSSGF